MEFNLVSIDDNWQKCILTFQHLIRFMDKQGAIINIHKDCHFTAKIDKYILNFYFTSRNSLLLQYVIGLENTYLLHVDQKSTFDLPNLDIKTLFKGEATLVRNLILWNNKKEKVFEYDFKIASTVN